jgi:predicted nucleic acid-binding protein
MNRVLLDTDVILDKVLGREPWLQEATPLWESVRVQRVQAFGCAITPLNISYIVRRSLGSVEVRQVLRDLLNVVQIIPLNEEILRTALSSAITDYEDAVQHASALAASIDVIITRNIGDYKNATLSVLSPSDFIKQMKLP